MARSASRTSSTACTRRRASPALRAAALLWIEKALAYRQPGEGIGGFRMWIVGEGEELDWRNDPGFLTGSAGVGLALLAAATAESSPCGTGCC